MAKNSFKFTGAGSEFFGIMFVNAVLTLITFGIYGAWARARKLRYTFENIEYAGERTEYHGTGNEIFVGYLKMFGIIILLEVIYFIGVFSYNIPLMIVGYIILLLGLFAITPIALHGAMRYRLSRTSWKSIHMGYRGKKGELLKLYLKGIFLTLITLGIYGAWFEIALTKYLYKNSRLGNIEFDFEGNGKDYFFLNLKGTLLTIITFGIYSFWYHTQLNNYIYGNITAKQDDKIILFKSNLQVGEYALTVIGNFVLLIITFGIALPWIMVRTLRMTIDNIETEGDFDPNTVVQTEESYKDAAGEGFLDMLDFGDGIW